MIKHVPITMTHAEWMAEGKRRFGEDLKLWRFVCPSCGYVAAAAEWLKHGEAGHAMVAFSCVGRLTGADGSKTFHGKGGPCNYAGGGLFGLNPVHVTEVPPDGKALDAFAFADPLPP